MRSASGVLWHLARAAGVAAVVLSMGLTGCAPPPPQSVQPSKPPAPTPAPDRIQTVTRTIYVPSETSEQIEARKVSLPADKASDAALIQAVLDMRIGGERLFPEKSRVLSVKADDDGLAIVDLSEDVTGFSGGSAKEVAAVNSIVLTCATNPKVKKVLLKVEGRELESLGGHLDLTIPVEPDRSVIGK